MTTSLVFAWCVATAAALWHALAQVEGASVTGPTGAPVTTIHPSSSVAAFYAFLALTAIAPVIWTLPSRLARFSDNNADEAEVFRKRGLQRFGVAAVVSVCMGAFILGYGLEGMSRSVQLNEVGLEYRHNLIVQQIPWEDVSAAVLRSGNGAQTLAVVSDNQRTVMIDLGSFARPDQQYLVQIIPRKARLSLVAQRGEEYIWRR
jgi:hypothetical protein